jgi:hypothetical protein
MENDNEKTHKKPEKNYKKYCCKKCDFLSSNKKDFNRHKLTRKHKKTPKSGEKKPTVEYECKLCNKVYKYRSGLSRHKGKCKKDYKNCVGENGNCYPKLPSESNNVQNTKFLKKEPSIYEKFDKEVNDSSIIPLILQQMKQQNETLELLKKSIDTTTKIIPKIGNNNNNTISINLFLNEQCKNAMNLTDFINQLQVSLEDLQYSKNNGFVEGVTNIFTKQLKDLKPTERPIHCTDKKRLQFYVKEDNKWSKDANNEKIDKTIYNIKMKQTKKLTDWENLHPNYVQDPQLLNEWQQMLNNMTEDVAQPVKMKDKLKRNIAEHIQIKEALTDANKN